MTIPGFSAGASLRPARGRYRGRTGASGAVTASVVPQLPRQLELLMCLEQCRFAADFDACNQACHWKDFFNSGGGAGSGGGGGGGEVEPRCRIKCEPCRSDPDSETGRSRLCTMGNCEVEARPC